MNPELLIVHLVNGALEGAPLFFRLFQSWPGAYDVFALGVGRGAVGDLVVVAVVGLQDIDCTLCAVPAIGYDVKIIDRATCEGSILDAIGT